MNDRYGMGSYEGYGRVGVRAAGAADQLAFLRRVYALFTASLVFAAIGAIFSLTAGTSASRVAIELGRHRAVVPPMVGWLLHNPFLAMIGYFGAYFAAVTLQRRPGANVAALFGFTFVTGVYFSTIVFFAQASAAAGHTLSSSPVRDALSLTVMGFAGLTGYAFTTRREFSFLGGFLSMGLWVLIGASLLSMFFGGQALQLAVASVGVLVFGGLILYQTWVLRQQGAGSDEDAVSAALGLYLSVMNLFLFLLRILASGRDDR